MQEDIENKSLTLIINTSKLTARTLATAFMKFLRYSKNKVREHQNVKPQGKQSVKQLIAQNRIKAVYRQPQVQLAVFGADCRIILAKVFVIIIGINGIDRAAGNTNCRVAVTTAIGIADGGRIGRTNGCHIGIFRNCDRKISVMAILAGTESLKPCLKCRWIRLAC